MKKITNPYTFICFIVIIVYLSIAIFRDSINFYDAFIFICSISIVFLAINNINQMGIKFVNVFSVSYFGAIALNSFKLSIFQENKSFLDFYYFFMGPLLFVLIISYFENKTSKKSNRIKILSVLTEEQLTLMLLFAYLVTKIYIVSQTGIRLFDGNWDDTRLTLYIIPGVSALNDILMYILLMQIPMIKSNKFKLVLIVLIILLSGILMAKRGNIVRIFLFLFFYVLYNFKNKISLKNKLVVFLCIVIFFISFASIGNYRQKMRGIDNVNNIISQNLGVDLGTPVFNWVYAYIGINHDVMKQIFYEYPNTFSLKGLYLPLGRLVHGNQWVSNYYDYYKTHGINGFNASTFLSFYIADWGQLYFICLIIYGIILGFILRLCIFMRYHGGYIFLITFGSLLFFGNSFIMPTVFFSIIIGIFFRFFIYSGKNVFYKK